MCQGELSCLGGLLQAMYWHERVFSSSIPFSMQIPFFNAIADAQVVLLSGAGGGFDVIHGLPLYDYLRKQGKQVIFGNLSFSELQKCGAPELSAGCYEIKTSCNDLAYFPEKHLAHWFEVRGEHPPIYGFFDELGVQPLANAYRAIIAKHHVDTLVLVDGGTDSLMFGDESAVATLVEDACSLIAADLQSLERSFLLVTAFGVEQHHHFDHHAMLENIASLTRTGDFLGSVSLTQEMPEARNYLELVAYLNLAMPEQQSIVSNSIAAALRGEFGDYHSHQRTEGSVQFINPLMSLCWFFKLQGVASRLAFREKIEQSETMNEVGAAFRLYRAIHARRAKGNLPW